MKVDEKGNSRISTRALFRGTLLIGLGTLALVIVAISWFDHQAKEIRVAGRESTAKMMAEGVAIAIQDDVISENYAQIEGRLRQTLSDPQVLSILVADEDGKVAESYGALTNLFVVKIAKRYTFLIDPKGKVSKVYLSVDTSRHSQEIVDDLKKLSH